MLKFQTNLIFLIRKFFKLRDQGYRVVKEEIAKGGFSRIHLAENIKTGKRLTKIYFKKKEKTCFYF